MKLQDTNYKLIEISLEDLEKISDKNLFKIQNLAIKNNKMTLIPPDSINLSSDSNTMFEEIEILRKLSNLRKFTKLRRLYFLNIYLSRTPNEIEHLQHLEFLQFNYYKFFNPIIESEKLLRLRKLKVLVIDEFYLPENKIRILKGRLPYLSVTNEE